MKAWYILLPCILLIIALIVIFGLIFKSKKTSTKVSDQNKDEKSARLKRNYKRVCLITGILAIILFVVAIVIIATLGWILVGMAIIISMLFLTGVAGFCYAKYIAISVYQRHTKNKN